LKKKLNKWSHLTFKTIFTRCKNDETKTIFIRLIILTMFAVRSELLTLYVFVKLNNCFCSTNFPLRRFFVRCFYSTTVFVQRISLYDVSLYVVSILQLFLFNEFPFTTYSYVASIVLFFRLTSVYIL
jgi:hypothetical protein